MSNLLNPVLTHFPIPLWIMSSEESTALYGITLPRSTLRVVQTPGNYMWMAHTLICRFTVCIRRAKCVAVYWVDCSSSSRKSLRHPRPCFELPFIDRSGFLQNSPFFHFNTEMTLEMLNYRVNCHS